MFIAKALKLLHRLCVLMIYCVLNNITFKIFFKRAPNDGHKNGCCICIHMKDFNVINSFHCCGQVV